MATDTAQHDRNRQTSRVVLVAGMHRSGTSAFAGLLHVLGYDFGGGLMPPQKDVNAKGFWESMRVAEIHERVLNSLGLAWHSCARLPEGWMDSPVAIEAADQLARHLEQQFSSSSAWAIKDPRLCRLLPLWKSVLEKNHHEDPIVIHIIRHPWEVASSLVRRDGHSRLLSYLLWMRYSMEAEYHSRGMRRIFVPYESYLEAPGDVMRKVVETTGMSPPRNINEVESPLREFLSPSLRHHHFGQAGVDDPPPRLIQEAYQLFQSAAFTSGENLRERFEDLSLRLEDTAGYCLAALAENAGGTQAELAALRVQLAESSRRLERKSAKIANFQSKVAGLKAKLATRTEELRESKRRHRSVWRQLFG